jgi:hypothetical protein
VPGRRPPRCGLTEPRPSCSDPPNDDAFLSPIPRGRRAGVLPLRRPVQLRGIRRLARSSTGRILQVRRVRSVTVVSHHGARASGEPDGVAPGVKLDVGWQKLTALDRVRDRHRLRGCRRVSFVYTWLEGTIAASDWLSLAWSASARRPTRPDSSSSVVPWFSIARTWMARLLLFNSIDPTTRRYVFARGMGSF